VTSVPPSFDDIMQWQTSREHDGLIGTDRDGNAWVYPWPRDHADGDGPAPRLDDYLTAEQIARFGEVVARLALAGWESYQQRAAQAAGLTEPDATE
jgi:hypothetical protein